MVTLPSEIAPEELVGHEAKQKRSKHVASRSVDVTKSTLLKRKSSPGHAPKPPALKRRKSSDLHVKFVRSPLLNRALVSPKMRYSGAKHLRSPMIRDEPSSTHTCSSRIVKRSTVTCSGNTTFDRRPSVVDEDEVGEDEGDEASKIQSLASSCDGIHMEALPDDSVLEDVEEQRSVQHQERKDAAARSLASKPPGGVERKRSASHLHFVTSPVLNRMLQSPRISPSRAMHVRSPSQMDRSLSQRSSSSYSSEESSILNGSEKGMEERNGSLNNRTETEVVEDGNVGACKKYLYFPEAFLCGNPRTEP